MENRSFLCVFLALITPSDLMPAENLRIEKVFDITQGDKVNIDLAERVGVTHLAVSYPQGVNCTLKKTSVKEPYRTCRNVTVPVCRTVQKVHMKNVTEDCSQQAEYCQYNFRTQELTKQTIVCQRSSEQICDESCSPSECPAHCERNPIVVCSTVPQTVAITERKQKCGKSGKLQTTKICFTYPDASWVCKEPRQSLDCNSEEVRLVSHEVAMPRIDCQEKEVKPICVRETCRLKSNVTDCLTTDIPTEVRLEDQICEQCLQGRTKLRPVVVQGEQCDGTQVQEFCAEGVEDSSKWSKTCSIPRNMRESLIQEVLQHTQDQINEIPDGVGQDKETKQRNDSKIVRLKLPSTNQRQRGPPTQGANIFFAKQFFKPGQRASSQIKSESGDKRKEANIALRPRTKVNFQFDSTGQRKTQKGEKENVRSDVKEHSIRPTGIPYVYSDLETETRFTHRPTPKQQNQDQYISKESEIRKVPDGVRVNKYRKGGIMEDEGKLNKMGKEDQSSQNLSNPRFKNRPLPNSVTLGIYTTESSFSREMSKNAPTQTRTIRTSTTYTTVTTTTPTTSATTTTSTTSTTTSTSSTSTTTTLTTSTTTTTSTTSTTTTTTTSTTTTSTTTPTTTSLVITQAISTTPIPTSSTKTTTFSSYTTQANDKNEDIDLIIQLLATNNNVKITTQSIENNRPPVISQDSREQNHLQGNDREFVTVDGFNVSKKRPKEFYYEDKNINTNEQQRPQEAVGKSGPHLERENPQSQEDTKKKNKFNFPFVPKGFYEREYDENDQERLSLNTGKDKANLETKQIESTAKSISVQESSIIISETMFSKENNPTSTVKTQSNRNQDPNQACDGHRWGTSCDPSNTDSQFGDDEGLPEDEGYSDYQSNVIIQGKQEKDINSQTQVYSPTPYSDGPAGDVVTEKNENIKSSDSVEDGICASPKLASDRVRCKLKACFNNFNKCFF